MSAFSFRNTEHFLPMLLGRTARDTLQEFIDIDVTAGDLVRILNENQAYRDLFFRFVNKKTAKKEKPPEAAQGEASPATSEKKEPPSPTHRLISLLGMLGSRNLILALRIHRLTERRFPVSAEGDVEVQAGDYLKRALEAEDLFVRNKLEYSETAYAAGVYFDLANRVYAKDEAMKKREAYAQRTWQRGLRTGLVAYFLAEKVAGQNPRSALAAGMLAHAGKLHLNAFMADYGEFEEALDKATGVPQLAALLLEREKFGVAQEDVGAHSLYYFDVFREHRAVVANFREPYNLKGADENHYRLALLVSLADAMARSWKIPADEKDTVFAEWSAYPAYSTLRLRRATLIEVIKRAMTLK